MLLPQTRRGSASKFQGQVQPEFSRPGWQGWGRGLQEAIVRDQPGACSQLTCTRAEMSVVTFCRSEKTSPAPNRAWLLSLWGRAGGAAILGGCRSPSERDLPAEGWLGPPRAEYVTGGPRGPFTEGKPEAPPAVPCPSRATWQHRWPVHLVGTAALSWAACEQRPVACPQVHGALLSRQRRGPGPDEQLLHWPGLPHQLQHLLLRLLRLWCQLGQALREEPVRRH